MKKHLLVLAFLGITILHAQTWSEDFNSTTAQSLPAGWLQNNVDGLIPQSNLSAYNFGTNAWVTNHIGTPYYTQGRCVMSLSWYSPAGIANDWLITPSFTVPAGAYIAWEGAVAQGAYPDGYEVRISTTGTTIANFSTNLLTVAGENYAQTLANWNSRGINLSAYTGQTVRIAFVNNSNDMNRLYLDNIKVVIPIASDGNVLNLTDAPRYVVAGPTPIDAVFKNYGSSVANNATMNYKIDNGPTTTETISVGPLNCMQTSVISFTTNATLTAGTHSVKIWVTQVDGVNETNLANDTAKAIIYVASQSTLTNALVEEWSSSTCGNACSQFHQITDPVFNSNSPNTGGRVNVIKYQVNFPSPSNDPSYNLHVGQRLTPYNWGGIPSTIVGGDDVILANTQSMIDNCKNEPAFASITATLNVIGTTITGSATITPFLTIASNSPLRVYQALLQKQYTFANPSGAQQTFYHVMRQMYPDGNGLAVTVADGVPQTVSFNHTINTVPIFPPLAAQNSNNFWTSSTSVYEYVVFLQDEITGKVIQSGSSNLTTTGLAKLSKDENIGVYPNPAKDLAVVGIRLNNNSIVDIAIYDATGKLVFVNKGAQVEHGDQEIHINTTEFANGVYNIIVNTNEGTLKSKLIINK
jgi:hypothetical protein